MRVLCGVLLLALTIQSAAVAQKALREVSFATDDGGRVFANLYGSGGHAVVLAHGAIFNKESWDALARSIAADGMRALAIDFRGYGKSNAGADGKALHLDVLAGVRYLKSEGAARVSVVGGSMGGSAAAQASVQSKPGEIDRLVLLAAGSVAQPNRLKGRKLFIVSEGDGARNSVVESHRRAPEPKKLVILPGSAHAQHVFKTDQAERLESLILDWLR